MAPLSDPGIEINAIVHAKAIHVHNFAECARLYGSAATTKLVIGQVTDFSRSKSQNNRLVTTVTARWWMSGYEVVKCLGLRCVRDGVAPEPSVLPAPLPSSGVADAAPPSSLETLADVASQACPPVTPAPVIPEKGHLTPAASPFPNVNNETDPASQVHDVAAASPLAPTVRLARPAGEPSAPPPVVVHGFEWRDADVLQPIGGPVARRASSVRTIGDEVTAEGGDWVGFGRSRTPLDYFLADFSQDQLARVRLTSAKLVQAGVLPTSPGELVNILVCSSCPRGLNLGHEPTCGLPPHGPSTFQPLLLGVEPVCRDGALIFFGGCSHLVKPRTSHWRPAGGLSSCAGRESTTLSRPSTPIGHPGSHRETPSALTNPSLDGTGKVATGLPAGSQCTSPSIANRRTGAKFKTLRVAAAD